MFCGCLEMLTYEKKTCSSFSSRISLANEDHQPGSSFLNRNLLHLLLPSRSKTELHKVRLVFGATKLSNISSGISFLSPETLRIMFPAGRSGRQTALNFPMHSIIKMHLFGQGWILYKHISFSCALQILYFVFTNWRFGNPTSSKSVGLLPQQHVLTLYLCVTFW